jgi:chromate transporter
LFLRLGFTAFGGPAAHIAMMRAEVVDKRKWLTEQEFLDLLGATNLIPGPNSTEMAIHIGLLRAGWRGLLLAGLCFIAPAMLIVLALAWLYVEYGSTPQATWLLYGIKPVVIVLILQALWSLGKTAVKPLWLGFLGLAILVLFFLGFNELALLFGGALFWVAVKNVGEKAQAVSALLPFGLATAVAGFSLTTLFLSFLKIGAVLYGSGYVLFTFLRAEFVERLAWLTDQQLLDAIAIGQVTPGPLFTSATFIGYVLGGLPGSLVATLGIFLPSFVFVWLSAPWVKRARSSPWASAFLDGVNISALALMAGVTWQLASASFVDLQTIAIGAVAAILLFRYQVNSAWLVLGGALAGLLVSLFSG